MPARHRPADLRKPISPFMAMIETQRQRIGLTRSALCRRVEIIGSDGKARQLSPGAYSRYMNEGSEPAVSIWMGLAEAVHYRVRVDQSVPARRPRSRAR